MKGQAYYDQNSEHQIQIKTKNTAPKLQRITLSPTQNEEH